MDKHPLPRWLQFWQQLPRSLQAQAVQVGLVLLLFGSLALVFVTAWLFSWAVRLVLWLQEQESPYPIMSDAYFTQCLERVEDLHAAALELKRRESTPGLSSDSAYATWHRLAGEFDQRCSGRHRPDQAIPAHPAYWLPHLGLSPRDWPKGVPGVPE